VVGWAGDGEEAVAVVRRTRPDLLFLDVQMRDLDGFGVLAALGPDAPRGVVFVTAHDEHALRAFEVHAVDYVMKPFGRPRFRAAVERAIARLDAEDALTMRSTLSTLIAGQRMRGPQNAGSLERAPGGASAPASRIGVRTGSRTLLVDTDEIAWLEADGDYVRLHTDAKIHLVSARMHALERLLGAGRFARIHRSVIVNLSAVRELRRDPDGGGAVVLRHGVRLRVARGRWEALEEALGLLG